MRSELLWRRALQRSAEAELAGALVPLATELLELPQIGPFVLRRLLSATPKHLRQGGPKANPFLPWEGALEVDRLGSGHVVLLNKYPVQPGHLLLITAGLAAPVGLDQARGLAGRGPSGKGYGRAVVLQQFCPSWGKPAPPPSAVAAQAGRGSELPPGGPV